MKSRFQSSGFTLLEVLVAGLILFMVVATVSSIFYASLKSKQNAEQYTLSSTYAPMLAEHIRLLVLDGENSGRGYFLGTNYSWSSKKVSSKPVLSYQDVTQTGSGATLEGQSTLWTVNLRISYKNKQQNYNFNVASWD